MTLLFLSTLLTASADDGTLGITGNPVMYASSDTAETDYRHLASVISGEVVMITETGFLTGRTHRVLARDGAGETTAALVRASEVLDEVVAVTDLDARTIVVIIDDDRASRTIHLDGRCDDHIRLAGLIEPGLLNGAAQRELSAEDLRADFLGLSQDGDVYEDFTALPPARFGDFWMGIINPDSMYGTGCVSSNPTPHP